MDSDQGSTVPLFLVFGTILIGAIALFSRIMEQRDRRREEQKGKRRDDTSK